MLITGEAMKISERSQLDFAATTNAAVRTILAEHAAMCAEIERLKAEVEHMRPIYVAALAWHEAPHVHDANCSAGDCDSCPARTAEETLHDTIDEATPREP